MNQLTCFNAYNTTIYHYRHQDVANDMNQLLSQENVPKWQASSQSIGNHYYHPMQTYARGVRNRMPTYQYDDSRRFIYFPEEKAKKHTY